MTAGARARARTARIARVDALIDASWRALGSPRFALLLIFAFAAAAFIGAAIMQAPPPALSDQEQYRLWLGEARQRYGIWTPLFDRLEWFRVFQSFWFRGLILLLVVSILISTLRRLRALPALLRPRVSSSTAEWTEHGRLSARLTRPEAGADLAADAIATTLRANGFHVRTQETADGVALAAEKHRFTRAIQPVYHCGLVIVLLGAFLGARGGFTETQFVVTEGAERAVEHGTGLTVRLDSFADEYYAQDPSIPSDYRSDIVLLKDGNEVKRGTVRVNEPLRYGSLRIHQAYYGPAATIRVAGADGQVLVDQVVPLTWRDDGRPTGSIEVPGSPLQIFVLAPAGAYRDPVIQPGEIRLELYRPGTSQPAAVEHIAQGGSRTIGDLRFSFERESRFTGLIVIRDPGMPVVWVGAAIFLIGAAVSLLRPYRRLHVRLRPAADGPGTEARIAAQTRRGRPFDREFARLIARLESTSTARSGAARGESEAAS